MSRILIFAGTTEGRELAEMLVRNGVACDVRVATEYGSMVLQESSLLKIHQGRLDIDGMKRLYEETGCDIVVDATHPYADIVTDTIKKSLEGNSITYIRLLRVDYNNNSDSSVIDKNIIRYDSTEKCSKALADTEGRILLTTGSKELKAFCNDESLKNRLVVRVLPGMESLKLCYDAGLEGKQIIAMQGPFTKETNKAIIEQYDIKHLVTKESGTTGGVDTKLEAAYECGVTVHAISRPQSDITGYSMNETVKILEEKLGVTFDRGNLNITLAGIGCGSEEGLTLEVKNVIEKADYIFGAERMLSSISANIIRNAVTYPYYLKKDILPILDQIKEQKVGDSNIVILFSGDSGFYSGAENMFNALKEQKYVAKIFPGISSISLQEKKIGISWQDAKIISLHGIDEDVWIPRLKDAVRYNKKVMFICSGVKDIRRVGEVLTSNKYKIYIGYQLSYENECITTPSIEVLQNYKEEGLYVCAIINDSPDKKILTPHIDDSQFKRSDSLKKVPMTKEDIRHLSVCRLNLKSGDVVYDIGSGTGSIAIETASLSPDIKVYAIECIDEALDLIKTNISKFDIDNIKVIKATAPEGLGGLEKADAAFIGGSRGHLEEILQKLYVINPNMRIVMNAVSMESIAEMNTLVKSFPVTDLNISQVAVTNVKELGNHHMMQANNPVFIYSFNFTEEK